MIQKAEFDWLDDSAYTKFYKKNTRFRNSFSNPFSNLCVREQRT